MLEACVIAILLLLALGVLFLDRLARDVREAREETASIKEALQPPGMDLPQETLSPSATVETESGPPMRFNRARRRRVLENRRAAAQKPPMDEVLGVMEGDADDA